jgi:hypothetical protein
MSACRCSTHEILKRIANPDVIVPFNDGFDYALIWRFV